MDELLDISAVNAALAELPGWVLENGSLVRIAQLPSFKAAISVVDHVAKDAEKANHHPDIDIRWRTLTFRLLTHAEGGITGKDVDLAHKISARIDAVS